ncbi:MAG TPA: hypothetical protein VLA89_09280 [Gemmatimonadales bacterium]|nr:hypothetical protein [Gemmatimonadales bacterium]
MTDCRDLTTTECQELAVLEAQPPVDDGTGDWIILAMLLAGVLAWLNDWEE